MQGIVLLHHSLHPLIRRCLKMKSKRFFNVGLAVAVVVVMMLSAFGGLKLTKAQDEVSEIGIVYLKSGESTRILDNIGIDVIETYDDFQLAKLTPAKIATLKRSGIESSVIGDTTTISMQKYNFDTTLGEPILPDGMKASNTNSLYILQFIGPIKAYWVDEIKALGISVSQYIPNNAYLVRGDVPSISIAKGLGHVQWIGPYHPAYKFNTQLASGSVRITVLNGPSVSETLTTISTLCPGTEFSYSETNDYYEMIVQADSSIFDDLARLDDVIWMEQVLEDKLYDETSSEIIGGTWTANTPYGAFGNFANIAGWDGTNIVVAVADTGLGNGVAGSANHLDFTGRVVGGKGYGTLTSWADGHGHGTHCSGIVSANGFTGTGVKYAATQYYCGAGVAPDSKLYAQRFFDNGGVANGIPSTQAGWDTFFNDAYTAGAYVHSNSWGSSTGGAYSANDVYYDQHVRDSSTTTTGQQPLIITVAAGNDGSTANTIGTPGNGKNVITVGASENYHPDAGSYNDLYDALPGDADNIAHVISFSSRGLSDDNRIKPDVLAPGTAILSPRSPNAPTNCLYGTYSVDNRYEWCSGTSQANPHVAGAAAVITDWWQAGHSAVKPMPAMVKALLVNTAIDVGTLDIPNGNEGWGRAYLPTIVAPTVNVMNNDNPQVLATGQIYTLQVAYQSNTQPLKITMAYTDAPGAAGSNPSLVNNLNLRVTAPGGQIWYGNSFTGGVSTSGTQARNTNIAIVWDTNTDNFDDRNNVECVYIPTTGLQTGTYTIEVIGTSVPTAVVTGGQDFAITVYNAVPPGTFATATGPIGGPTNVAAVTLTYGYTGTPTSVNLYYTKSTSSPYTWVLAGNDATVDGSYAYTITAGSGTYGWLASAVGGGSTEPSPPGSTIPPEATSYILDVVAPAAPTGFTVHHWGPSTITNTQTRYMANTNVTVNGLTTYSLQLTQSTTGSSYLTGSAGIVYTGFRAWKRSSAGVETEITAGSATAIVNRAATGAGIQTTTWVCPATVIVPTDSLVVRVYQSLATPPTNLAATFTTETLGATSIDAGTWTLNYYTRRGGVGSNLDRFYWGTATYNSNITGIKSSVSSNPLSHNTLNWTHSGTDVSQYVIYRSALSTGPWDATTVLTSVPVGTNTFCDLNKGQADATLWWYVVRAEDAVGNREMNTNAVQEPGSTPPYAISLTGKLANSWVFVSFPSSLSGAIQTILNDATAGDSGTTWTVAKWFNAQDKADPWKTYRVGSTVNDMPTMTNTMGVWLWITANGGDQVLTLSNYAPYPAAAANINLYTGWNMVGYPSATNRLGTATLPAQVDYVSVWQAATPYVTDLAPGTVTMSHGNAYWVRVTADCTWTVQP
jgi:hypothetical protein